MNRVFGHFSSHINEFKNSINSVSIRLFTPTTNCRPMKNSFPHHKKCANHRLLRLKLAIKVVSIHHENTVHLKRSNNELQKKSRNLKSRAEARDRNPGTTSSDSTKFWRTLMLFLGTHQRPSGNHRENCNLSYGQTFFGASLNNWKNHHLRRTSRHGPRSVTKGRPALTAGTLSATEAFLSSWYALS